MLPFGLSDILGKFMKVYETHSPEETIKIAYEMALCAKAGDILTLEGDLGVGKTLFASGFAKGLEIDEPISSPTFTIVQEYEDGRLPLYHFDVYRIGDPEEMDEVGFDDYLNGGGICLIEWADLIEELIPDEAIRIYIEKDLDAGYDYRRITVDSYENIRNR